MLDMTQKHKRGFWIAYTREGRGLSQDDLAKRCGLPPSQISHFETGNRRPSWTNLLKLADALEVSTDQLMGRGTTTGTTANLQDLMGELTFEELEMVKCVVRMLIQHKSIRQ